jgi:hypothetical protein
MALGLHEAAHDTVDRVQGSVVSVGYHGGDDGVVWPLSWSNGIGVAWGEREVTATVLKHESTALRYDCGAKTEEVGVDEGDSIAVLVGYGKVDGVGMVVCWRPLVEDLV